MQFDFSKNTVVDAIENVPVDFRGLYAEGDDGKFSLRSDDDGVKSAVAAIQRMNGALNASRKEVTELSKKSGVDLTALADYGDTPEAIASGIQAKIDELETKLESTKGKKSAEDVQRQIDKMKNDLMEAHKAEMTKVTQNAEALRTQLHQTLVSDVATREIVAAGGDPELLMPFVSPTLKPIEVDGKYEVRVVDDAGDVRYSGITGGAMDIKERVAELKGQEKFGRFFTSDAPSGGGAKPTPRNPNPKKPSEMSPNEKISAGLRAGQAGGTGSGYANANK